VRLAQSPRFLSSPAASFRFTELLWQHLKPIMSIDRVALFEALCRLLLPAFDEVIFRIGAPTHQMAPVGQPLVRRALDLVQWAEQGGSARMTDLSRAIRIVAPGVLT